MKISQINAYPADGRTQVNIVVDSELSVAEALSSVLALFAGVWADPKWVASQKKLREAHAVEIAEVELAEAKVAQTPASAYENISRQVSDAELQAGVDATKATRTRRPRAAAPDAAPAQEPTTGNPEGLTIVVEAQEPRRRTRVTAEAPAETVKTITDADLAKACSNAAAIVGIEVVQAVINDFAVKNMQELAPDVRERFLSELDDEIKLAKEEFARAGK